MIERPFLRLEITHVLSKWLLLLQFQTQKKFSIHSFNLFVRKGNQHKCMENQSPFELNETTATTIPQKILLFYKNHQGEKGLEKWVSTAG